MADIDRSVTVTLNADELREAVAEYVERMNGGDMPPMDRQSVVFAYEGELPDIFSGNVIAQITD